VSDDEYPRVYPCVAINGNWDVFREGEPRDAAHKVVPADAIVIERGEINAIGPVDVGRYGLRVGSLTVVPDITPPQGPGESPAGTDPFRPGSDLSAARTPAPAEPSLAAWVSQIGEAERAVIVAAREWFSARHNPDGHIDVVIHARGRLDDAVAELNRIEARR